MNFKGFFICQTYLIFYSNFSYLVGFYPQIFQPLLVFFYCDA